ncbi:anticodon-binding protein [Nonomuraea muscovyensis]|uniref:Arginyl-tRNA synthetase n=1 Tax=Nonomuraea muscovyensis TaxID=1124761 RepID=A0A7X0C9L6_9ACTN|nr:anticodon-binding protein [Nonomuraea muscovyensis]MBB6351103.1 arginyl-tRNA synthetase [Nonomuraea muscovyensis]
MRPGRLAEALGEPPAPDGTWEREAVYVSAVALRRARVAPRPGEPAAGGGAEVGRVAAELAGQVRPLDGVSRVEVRPNGFLRITVETPGELVEEVRPLDLPDPWPDLPRTWDNPGFVVRYAHARAAAVQRWARDLGVPDTGFRPELLDDPRCRAVLRVLAELPGRLAGRAPGWEAFQVRLATAYHDAHELAPAVPVGDEEPAPAHTARVRLARAVRDVLAGPDRI